MLIVGIGFATLSVILLLVCWHKDWDSFGWGSAATVSVLMAIIWSLVGGVWALDAYYATYPKLEAFYDSNADNYRMVVHHQNEVAVMNLKGPVEGEFFDGSDFSQSKETSNRYREYRDAANGYNLTLACYKRRGGTAFFWPMPKPDSRLKIIEIK